MSLQRSAFKKKYGCSDHWQITTNDSNIKQYINLQKLMNGTEFRIPTNTKIMDNIKEITYDLDFFSYKMLSSYNKTEFIFTNGDIKY